MEIKNNTLKKALDSALGLNLNPRNLIEDSKPQNEDTPESHDNEMTVLMKDEGLRMRAGRRFYVETLNQQKNIEEVVTKADEMLRTDPPSSNPRDDVDKGWVDECLDGAGKAYNEDLKVYWAKLLAGEIKQPGFYSLRAIDLMKKLSKRDAEKIRVMCKYVMYTLGRTDAFFFRTNERPYSYSDLSFLMELGLVDSSSFVSKQYRFKDVQGGMDLFVHGNICVFFKVKEKEYDLPIFNFTSLGKEILTIIDDQEVDVDYLKEVSKDFVDKNRFLEVEGGHFAVDGNVVYIVKDEIRFSFQNAKKEQ